MVDDWIESFPAVNVMQELREIRQWNLSRPKDRKTQAGILKHITGWLAREQDKGGATRQMGTTRLSSGLTVTQGAPARLVNNIAACNSFIKNTRARLEAEEALEV